MVTYTPFYRGVRSDHPLPYEDFWAARPVTPYIEDGRLWLPVQHVAARVGAELTVELAEASLRRGPHRIQLSANSDVMTTDVGPRRLPRPTRVAHGHLVVPAAPVLRALGATVTWDDQEQTITVSCPEAAPLEARVTDDHLYAILGAIPDGFAPPRPESYAADIGEHFQDPASPPWLAIGDFAGDGVEDVALFLQKGSQTGIGIVERANGGHFSFHWLPGSPHEATTLLDGTFFTVIQTRPPGEVAYYQEGETTPKSGRLRLGRDSLEVIAWGKAAVVYYWDADGEQYKSVVTAD
jgi:hypothetical protein